MDVLALIVIFVLICLLVSVCYIKKPFILRIELPKQAESTTPVTETVAPVISGYISNPSDVDNLMIGSEETDTDIGEAKKGFDEAIRRRNWTAKDVCGSMKRRGGATTDFGEAMIQRGGAKTYFGEAKRGNGAETDVTEAMTRRSGAKTDFGEAVIRRDGAKVDLGETMKRRNGAETDVGEAMKRGSGVEKGGFLAWVNERITVNQATDKYAEFRSFVQTNELDNEMKDLGTTYGLIKYIKKSLQKWKRQEMNIAITGNSGAGKSSLINALRKRKPNEYGAAKVGVVETTTKGRKYTYTENKFVALWDLPGTGTQTFTRDTYLNEMDFSRFDVVIIVTSTRFLENDIWLAKKMSALRKQVLLVRTKIDMDMVNAKRDYPDNFKEEQYISMIRFKMTENVRKGGLTQTKIEIYLVSSVKTDSYDFKQLNEKLTGLLNMKERAIPALLKEHVQPAIKKKQDSNKNEFNWHKFGSAIYGFLPIPNLETVCGNSNVSSIHERCLEKFCLDTKSLDKISKELGASKESLQKNLKSYRMTGETLLESTEEEEYPTTFKKFSKYMVPVIGFFYSAHKNVCTLEKCLEKICDVAAEDELGLVTKILHKLERDLHIDI